MEDKLFDLYMEIKEITDTPEFLYEEGNHEIYKSLAHMENELTAYLWKRYPRERADERLDKKEGERFFRKVINWAARRCNTRVWSIFPSKEDGEWCVYVIMDNELCKVTDPRGMGLVIEHTDWIAENGE